MTLRLKGSNSGDVSLKAPATAGDNTITLPTSNGSAEQFLKNSGTAGELEFSSMVETSTGVGIGTSSPSSKTHIKGGSLTVEHASPGTGTCQFNINSENNSQVSLSYDDQGSIAIGTAATPSNQGSFSEKARLDSSGRLLIGTEGESAFASNASAKLQVRATSDAPQIVFGRNDSTATTGETLGILSWYGNDGGSYQECASIRAVCDGNHANDDKPTSLQFFTCPDNSATLSQRLRIRTDGLSEFNSSSHVLSATTSVGAGTAKYLYRGHHSSGSTIVFNVWSNGNVESATNSYGGISDVKLKENIVDANSQWDDLKAIQVRNYNFKESTGQQTHTQLGVVAQEVETVSPGLVYDTADVDDEGSDLGTVTKRVNYSVLYMKAVKALQEAQTRIETLETQNTAQQTQIDDLLARVTALEAA